jgi:uncharacterized MAPEG superfamily protein
MLAKLPYILIFLALGLIYLPRAIVIAVLVKSPEGLDNNNPRDQQARLTGIGKRANGAHLNMLEAFPAFAVGMLVSLYAKVDLKVIVYLGALFVGLRALYIVCYLADKAWLRTTVWSIAALVTATLLLAPVAFGG